MSERLTDAQLDHIEKAAKDSYAEVKALRAQIEAVRELHTRCQCSVCARSGTVSLCRECEHDHPCDTIRALGDEE